MIQSGYEDVLTSWAPAAGEGRQRPIACGASGEDARKARTFREQMEKAKDNARTKGEAEAKRIVRQAQAQADEIFAQLDQLRRRQQSSAHQLPGAQRRQSRRAALNRPPDALHIHDQPQEPVYTPSRPIEVGDLVELPGVKMAASVPTVNNDGTLFLQAGKMKMTVKAQQVRLPEGQPKKKPAAPASGGSAVNLCNPGPPRSWTSGAMRLWRPRAWWRTISTAPSWLKLGTAVTYRQGTGALRKAVLVSNGTRPSRTPDWAGMAKARPESQSLS